jgi:hypothetical protein
MDVESFSDPIVDYLNSISQRYIWIYNSQYKMILCEHEKKLFEGFDNYMNRIPVALWPSFELSNQRTKTGDYGLLVTISQFDTLMYQINKLPQIPDEILDDFPEFSQFKIITSYFPYQSEMRNELYSDGLYIKYKTLTKEMWKEKFPKSMIKDGIIRFLGNMVFIDKESLNILYNYFNEDFPPYKPKSINDFENSERLARFLRRNLATHITVGYSLKYGKYIFLLAGDFDLQVIKNELDKLGISTVEAYDFGTQLLIPDEDLDEVYDKLWNEKYLESAKRKTKRTLAKYGMLPQLSGLVGGMLEEE